MASIPSEFEEKEFEAPLYNQLECGTNLVWSPGQVFEEHIGIDRALFLSDPTLWRFFGVAGPARGAFLHRYDWEFIWRQRPRRRQLPNFRLNLFLQAKRSHYYSRRPKHLRNHMGPTACWRFDVDRHQQEALEKVAAQLGNRAVVSYAAPAFHRISQLNAHTVRSSIIPNSTFPLVQHLTGHQSWYYSGPGGSGVRNIEPESVDGVGLEDLIRQGHESSRQSSSENTGEQLKTLGNQIYQVIEKEISNDNPRKILFLERLRQADQLAQDFEVANEAARAFLRVATFAMTFNVEWYVI